MDYPVRSNHIRLLRGLWEGRVLAPLNMFNATVRSQVLAPKEQKINNKNEI